jgi:hypothetical protein
MFQRRSEIKKPSPNNLISRCSKSVMKSCASCQTLMCLLIIMALNVTCGWLSCSRKSRAALEPQMVPGTSAVSEAISLDCS